MNSILTKSILTLSLFLSLIIISCETEQTKVEQEPTFLPSVHSFVKISSSDIIKLKSFNSSFSGRINESLDFENAITATYEGYEEAQFIYIPDSSTEGKYNLYTVKNGIISDNVLIIENTANSMRIINEAGIINIDIEGNIIKSVDTEFNLAFNGRMECDIAGGFIECTNQAQAQLIEVLGTWGTLAFDFACGIWVVCRGAFIVACSVHALEWCP